MAIRHSREEFGINTMDVDEVRHLADAYVCE